MLLTIPLGDCIPLLVINKNLKNVLITGGNGFIGKNTAILFSQYVPVYGIGHGSFEKHNHLPSPFTQWIEDDISCLSLHENLNEIPALVIHCAGGSSVAASLAEPKKDFQRNLQTTLEVLEYLRLYSPKSRFIYLSSAAVYGNVAHLPIWENEPCMPISPYGLHKKFAEELCHFYHLHYSIPMTIVRPFSVYGPGLKKQLLWDACNKFSSNQSQFFGDGTELRDWIHISDLVTLLWNIVQSEKTVFEVINACSGKGKSVADVLTTIKHYFPSAPPISFNHNTKGGDPIGLVGTNSKALHTGWRQNISLDEGIKEYILWYKKEYKKYE